MPRKPSEISETVSCGHRTIGSVEGVTGVLLAYGPEGQHVGTFAAVADARRALFQLHQEGQDTLMCEGGRK